MEIISEQDIINTYDERQQEQCRLYYEYKKIKQQNPEFGYKRIAGLLGQHFAKTRWWHCGKHIPTPVQTVEWLKARDLLPLAEDNPKLLLISKVFGATFGDGGIFGNLNAIFLSSSELEAVKEFGDDLKELFGNEVGENSRVIEGGIEGHSWCYQNTNRNLIRFFMALGAPIGDKSLTKLVIPKWINISEEVEDEFYGSLFGAEMGIPKIHISDNHLDTLSIGITATDKLTENRMDFLKIVASYLNKKYVKTGNVCISDHKKNNRKGEPTKVYRLLLSLEFENVVNFMTLTKMNYCKYKKEKLADTMNKFSEIKRQKFEGMLTKGRSEEEAMNLLNITPVVMEIISQYEDFRDVYAGKISC